MPLFVNRVMLAGSLVRDPKTRFFGDQNCVCNFTLAVNRRYKGKDGEQKEDTVFADVAAWGRTAELVAQFCSKGRNVFVEGRLVMDEWQTQEGQKRQKLKVNADIVNFIDSGNKQGGQQQPAPAVPPPADLGDDEPPF